MVTQMTKEDNYNKALDYIRKYIPVKLKTGYSDESYPYFKFEDKINLIDPELVYLASIFDLTKVKRLDSIELRGLMQHWTDCLVKYCSTELKIKSKEEMDLVLLHKTSSGFLTPLQNAFPNTVGILII